MPTGGGSEGWSDLARPAKVLWNVGIIAAPWPALLAGTGIEQAGVGPSVIALWLSHETGRTTQVYLHADLRLKERAHARTPPPPVAPGRYRPPDSLLAFLEGL
jgi:hypothetical protein